MERRKAKKLKVGDLVIGYTAGVHSPARITGIIHNHADAKARVPLFNLDGYPNPITYRLLEPSP